MQDSLESMIMDSYSCGPIIYIIALEMLPLCSYIFMFNAVNLRLVVSMPKLYIILCASFYRFNIQLFFSVVFLWTSFMTKCS